MQKRAYFPGVAILSVTALIAIAVSHSAIAKVHKLSYEDAFAKCKQEIGAGAPGSESLSTSQRSTAGGACMKRYGYRLKK
jgi:hypothetical protein